MDVIYRETRWATGRSTAFGGAGDSGLLTAYGVYQGMRAAADAYWGTPSLRGRRVGVSGLGKVGRRLIGHLLDEGAAVLAADVSEQAVAAAREQYPSVTVVEPDTLMGEDLDIFSPNALGGVLTADSVRRLKARVVCGGANNQLATPDVAQTLADAGVLYAPDFVVNSGGVIQVSDELHGYNPERARQRAEHIFDTTRDVFSLAGTEGVLPEVAAERLAERRMAAVGRLRGILLPGHT